MTTKTKTQTTARDIYIFTTYEDEKTGLFIELTAEKMQTWRDARVYFELYQSDRRTRVRALYLILNGTTSNPKNDFQDKRGRWWSSPCATNNPDLKHPVNFHDVYTIRVRSHFHLPFSINSSDRKSVV